MGLYDARIIIHKWFWLKPLIVITFFIHIHYYIYIECGFLLNTIHRSSFYSLWNVMITPNAFSIIINNFISDIWFICILELGTIRTLYEQFVFGSFLAMFANNLCFVFWAYFYLFGVAMKIFEFGHRNQSHSCYRSLKCLFSKWSTLGHHSYFYLYYCQWKLQQTKMVHTLRELTMELRSHWKR